MLGLGHYRHATRPTRLANLGGPGEIASSPIHRPRQQFWRDLGSEPRRVSQPARIDIVPVAVYRNYFRAGCGQPALERIRLEDGIARNQGDEIASAFPHRALQ